MKPGLREVCGLRKAVLQPMNFADVDLYRIRVLDARTDLPMVSKWCRYVHVGNRGPVGHAIRCGEF